MKKSELKKELEVAKATLELAMVALRVAAEKNNLKSSIKPPMIPIYQLKRLMDKFKKNQTIIPNPEPQAGDKIVEDEQPKYECIKDYQDWIKKGTILEPYTDYKIEAHKGTYVFYNGAKNLITKELVFNNPQYFQKVQQNETIIDKDYIVQATMEVVYPDYVCTKDFDRDIIKGTILKYVFINEYLGECYQSTTNKQMCYAPEFFKDNKEYFEVYEPKKETPLADLNKEVQAEQSYIIQAKEAVDKFMPLVTGWRANDPCGLRDAEVNKIVWSLSDSNHKKAAIKVAIAHFELIQKQGGWLTHIECVQIIGELQKMLAS